MDSKPKAHYKDRAAQVVPDHTPEAAMTEYFLSKYEQHFSKYVIIYKFSGILTVIVQIIVIFWYLTMYVVLLLPVFCKNVLQFLAFSHSTSLGQI